MARLGRADLDGILTFVGEVESSADVGVFRDRMLAGLQRLVPCDVVGYNEVDVARGTSVVVLDPADAALPDVEATLARLAYQHPLVLRQAAGDLSTASISDHLSARAFHRLELYAEIYRRLGAEDQIAFGLPGDVVVGIALNRSRRGFSVRDRTVLEALRPHLTRAFGHARARARADALVAALGYAARRAGAVVVPLGRDGRPAQLDAGTEALLSSYLDAEGLAAWVASRPGASVLSVAGERGRLALRLFADADPPLLLVQEQRQGPRAETLRALGLTPREAQVLGLAALGHDDERIARELTISVRTVRKHCENIYGKLEVHGRAEAVARAYTAG